MRETMTEWTIETCLSHIESTGTHEQRKCVRLIRRLLETERRERPEQEPQGAPSITHPGRWHVNGHAYLTADGTPLEFTNCDNCGEQFGARFTRACARSKTQGAPCGCAAALMTTFGHARSCPSNPHYDVTPVYDEPQGAPRASHLCEHNNPWNLCEVCGPDR